MKHLKAWNLSRQCVLAESNRGAQTKDPHLNESATGNAPSILQCSFLSAPIFILLRLLQELEELVEILWTLDLFSYIHTKTCTALVMLNLPSFWICRKFIQIEKF